VSKANHQPPVSFDALLLVALLIARVRIDTLADLVAPRPEETIRRLPVLGRLLSDSAWALMRNWLTDPISLLTITAAFALSALYLVVDALRMRLPEVATYRLKLGLILAICAVTVAAQSLYLVGLRHLTGPASFAHDGGVIQTEEAAKLFRRGLNPYREDYSNTPLAEWGLELRTAVYHYPYLPFTFLLSAPVMAMAEKVLGWYDQRLLYLACYALMLALVPSLSSRRGQALLLTAILGLNPIMGSDVIFGMNDVLILSLLVLGLFCLRRGHPALGSLAFALAWASKSTAWFLLPYYIAYLAGDALRGGQRLRVVLARFWPALACLVVILLPFVLWDPGAIFDDVWAWSAGTSPSSYQIRGWGLSNLVLALSLVPDKQAYFPFWIPQLIVCLPLLIGTVRRQWRDNTLQQMMFGCAVLFGAYSFLSRFCNENYFGFFLSLLAISAFVDEPSGRHWADQD
jgi:hypothetical protein